MKLKFSQDIETLLKRLSQQPLTLEDVVKETQERGLTLVIGLLTLPFLFPMPPGFTTILGGGSLLLSLQMALGRRTPWLPKKVAQFQFPQKFVLLLLSNLQKVTGVLEKLTQTRRWKHVANNPYVWQWNGLCMAWLTFLLMLPIPFTNPIPTVAILLLVVATMELDGLLIFASYLLTGLITLFFGIVGYLFWKAPEFINNLLQ